MKQIIINGIGDGHAEHAAELIRMLLCSKAWGQGVSVLVSDTELQGEAIAGKLESTIEPLAIRVEGIAEVHEAIRAVEKLNAALDDTAVKLRALSFKG